MALNVKIVFCIVSLLQWQFAISENGVQDSHCYSRFDYESKMLERIVMVEHKINLLQESTKQELEDIRAAKNEMLREMKTVTKHLRSEQKERQAEMSTELKSLSEEVQNVTNAKLLEITDIGNSVKDTSNNLVEEQRAKHVQIETDINNMTRVLHGELRNKQEEIFNNLTVFAKALEEVHDAKVKEIANTVNDMTDLAEKLKEEQTLKLETIEIIGNDIKVEIQEKMLKLEAEDRLQDQKYESTLADFRRTVSSTWADIKAEGLDLKPAVVFEFFDVADSHPSYGAAVRFVNELVNTNNVYSADTGYFTTPVNGTYMFSVQVCGLLKTVANFRLFLNDQTILADASMYDFDSDNTCTTSNAVALLRKGDTVCVQAGPNGLQIQSNEGKRSAFMGALVH